MNNQFPSLVTDSTSITGIRHLFEMMGVEFAYNIDTGDHCFRIKDSEEFKSYKEDRAQYATEVMDGEWWLFTDDEADVLDGFLHDNASLKKEEKGRTVYSPIEFGSERYERCLKHVIKRNPISPIRDWLATIPEWDGVDRSDYLCQWFGIKDTPFHRWASMIVPLGIYLRKMEPVEAYRPMVVLISRENFGKSQLCASFLPKFLRKDAFLDNFNLDDDRKDMVDKTRGKAVVEVAEMSGSGKAGDKLKQFLTSEQDTIRLSYGRRAQRFPHNYYLIGTANPAQALPYDPSSNAGEGHTRFVFITLEHECRGVFAKMDEIREQLYAQAIAMYSELLVDWMKESLTPKWVPDEFKLEQRIQITRLEHKKVDEGLQLHIFQYWIPSQEDVERGFTSRAQIASITNTTQHLKLKSQYSKVLFSLGFKPTGQQHKALNGAEGLFLPEDHSEFGSLHPKKAFRAQKLENLI